MRTALEQQVLAYLRRSRMLEPGDCAGVAVSGGADSVALLCLLEALRERLGITLAVLHFDHALRGAESEADAEFVAELARARGLPFFSAREDVAAEAARNGWNLEDAARRLRYSFFERTLREGRATHVGVAHTADDQAETVLSHLMRGTGPAGLAGIYPVAAGVVRPLLATRRAELRRYLEACGQGWREDATNRDTRRLRARIREQLLPQLQRDFSPSIVEHLAGLASLAREEEAFWAAIVEEQFDRYVHRAGESFLIGVQDLLAPLHWNAAPRAAISSLRPLTERLIRRLYEKVRGDRRELAANHVQQVIHLASESTSGRRISLPGGIHVEREFSRLVFLRARSLRAAAAGPRETGKPANAYQYSVTLPERGEAAVSVPELGRRYRLKVIDWPSAERETNCDHDALDADLLRAPLILRNWRPGDAYRPRGRRQPRKLNRMLIAGRIPGRERAGWPVLESQGRVIWARGMPPAHEFCAREGTRYGLVIEEDRL